MLPMPPLTCKFLYILPIQPVSFSETGRFAMSFGLFWLMKRSVSQRKTAYFAITLIISAVR